MRRAIDTISIRHTLIGLASIALGLALLRHALRAWGPSEITAFIVMVYLIAHILAWFQPPRRKASWIVFGLVGMASLAAASWSPATEHLPTTRFLDELHRLAYPGFENGEFHAPTGATRPSLADFRTAGHAGFSVIPAFLGSLLTFILSRQIRSKPEPPFPPDGSLLKQKSPAG